MAEIELDAAQLERQLASMAVMPDDALEVITRLAEVIFPEGRNFGDPARIFWPEADRPPGAEVGQGNGAESTARLRARLEKSEARLRTLVEQLPAVVFLAALGADENEVYVSPQVETLLGFSQREWLENPLLWYAQLHPDDHEVVISAFTEGMQTGGPFRAEVRFFARDGHTVWIMGEAQLIRDAQGRPEYFQGVGFDVTASKKAQELSAQAERAKAEAVQIRAQALTVANEELTRLNVELEQAKNEAEEAAAARATFLATMSHELRTPMNSVIVLASLLADTQLSVAQQDMLRSLSLAADHLLDLINDILDFSRLRAGRVDLHEQPFDVAAWLENCLEIVAPRAAEKDLGLRYRVREGTPRTLVSDEGRLRQVLLNLLGNAVKFTHDGEIQVIVDAEQDSEGWRYRCTVHDTGMGIAADRISALFEEFEQADSGIAREFGGTGLGLAISRSIVDLLGGEITVQSAVGGGSEFAFSWRAQVTEAPATATVADPALAGRRVLIVDDRAADRDLLAEFCRSIGLEAVTAASGPDALDRLRDRTPFDLAVVDFVMPGMDGVATAEAMAGLEGAPPVVLSAYAVHGPEARGRGVRLAGFLPKPLRQSTLAATLAGLLSGEVAPVPVPAQDPTQASSRALRVLVAEDNLMNQQVLLMLLGAMGFDNADVVGTGDEAVEAVQANAYDVVLMDMMMPKTDGLTATRLIRARGAAVHQPFIVALTANAMPGDREACLAAGMDGYVAKPINRADLGSLLHMVAERLDADMPESTAATDPDPAPTSPSPALGAEPALDETTAHRVRDAYGPEAFATLVGLFRATAQQHMEQIVGGVQERQLERVAMGSHTIKSSAQILGAFEVAGRCTVIEESARQESWEGIDADAVDALQASLTEALVWLDGLAGAE